jgi:heme/copper-type cytochrome/quinol oxidase subunit 2
MGFLVKFRYNTPIDQQNMKKIGRIFLLILILLSLDLGSLIAEAASPSTRLVMPETGHYDALIAGNKFNQQVLASGNLGSQDIFRSFFWNAQTGKVSNFVIILNVILGAAAIMFIVVAGIRMVFGIGDAETFAKNRQKIIWIGFGLFIISAAEILAFQIFNPQYNLLGNATQTELFYKKAMQLKLFLQYLAAGGVLFSLVRTGYYFVLQPDLEETVEKEKQFVKFFIIGVGFIILAEVIIRGIVFMNLNGAGAPGGSAGEGSMASAVQASIELAGIVNYLLTFIAGAAVFMIVLASVYYVFSFGDEDRANSAKKMIIGSVVALIIAFSSYTIMRFVIVP